VSPSFRTARWVGLASVFVFVAAAAFGAKLWHKAPRDFFLSMAKDSDTAEPTLSGASTEPGTAGSFARLGGGAGSVQRGDTQSRASGVAQWAAAAGLVARHSGAGSHWTPWGNGSFRRGLNGSSGSSGSAALGGLWHSMTPFGGHGAGTADAPAPAHAAKPAATASAKPAPSTPKPSRPAPSPSSAPPAAPSIGGPPATAGSAVPAPADAPGGLGEHQTPLPEVGGGSGGSVGGPVGGGAGSPGGSMPGGSSSNPEPGTIALVGTGLLGLARAFRRRRV
jgi:hypothetical protein